MLWGAGWPSVRCLLLQTTTIVCFQETKINLFYSGLILETLGPDFDDYVYLPADGTRCGILLAWQDDRYHRSHIHHQRPVGQGHRRQCCAMVDPQEDANKIPFLQDLRDLHVDCPGPWMIYGDFNLIYRDEEKKNDHLDRRMMGRFRRCINDLARWQVPSLLPGVGRLRPQPTSAGLRPLAPSASPVPLQGFLAAP